jgi:hypothetical protein
MNKLYNTMCPSERERERGRERGRERERDKEYYYKGTVYVMFVEVNTESSHNNCVWENIKWSPVQ